MDRLFAKFMVVSVLLALSTAGGAWQIAANDGKPVKRPLDLPNGGKGYEEEEEEVPETITFYGQAGERATLRTSSLLSDLEQSV